MKTLIVSYLPNGRESNTGAMLDLFLEQLPAAEVVELDLLEQPAPTFDYASLQAYQKRHFRGENLTPHEHSLLSRQYELIEQLKGSDVVVMAYPMHNFSMPAPVKAYMDAVLFSGLTFQPGGVGLMRGHKALTLFNSAMDFGRPQPLGDYPNWDALSPLARIHFSCMGFDAVEVIGESLARPDREERLSTLAARLKSLVGNWYGSDVPNDQHGATVLCR